MTHHPADGDRRQPPILKTVESTRANNHTTIEDDPANRAPASGE